MKNLPSIQNYGDYSSDNYGKHTLRVDFGPLAVWFSYTTPVAFQLDGEDRVVRENEWNTTTGKHLNWIDGGTRAAKKARVSGGDFITMLREAMSAKVEAV